MPATSQAKSPAPFQPSAMPQSFLPSAGAYSQATEAMRGIAQASANYWQELIYANAALFSAFMVRSAGTEEERPSDAAHRPDCEAP